MHSYCYNLKAKQTSILHANAVIFSQGYAVIATIIYFLPQ